MSPGQAGEASRWTQWCGGAACCFQESTAGTDTLKQFTELAAGRTDSNGKVKNRRLLKSPRWQMTELGRDSQHHGWISYNKVEEGSDCIQVCA